MAILSLHAETDQANLTEIPPNLTNPVCIGTAGLLASQGSTDDSLLGTNSSFLLPLDQSVSEEDVATWCPWDLQLQPPTGPANGVYSYPDTTIQRPQFNPCYSACARYNKPEDCCTGAYGSPRTCKPSQYSQEAKKVCPDAYSFGELEYSVKRLTPRNSLQSQPTMIKTPHSSSRLVEASRLSSAPLAAPRRS